MTDHTVDSDAHPINRRQAVAGAGLAGMALAATACTVYGKQDAAPTSPASAPTAGADKKSGSATAPANALAKISDVPVGGGVIVGDLVLTQAKPGEFRALTTTCTHAGCKVNGVSGATINCPCHGSKFNLDGTVAGGPAKQPLTGVTIAAQGDFIVRA